MYIFIHKKKYTMERPFLALWKRYLTEDADINSNNNENEFDLLVNALSSALDNLNDPNYPHYDSGEDIFFTYDSESNTISFEILNGPFKKSASNAVKEVLKQFKNFKIDNIYREGGDLFFDIIKKM